MKVFQIVMDKILLHPKSWISVLSLVLIFLMVGNVYQCTMNQEDELLQDLETLSSEQADLLDQIKDLTESSKEKISDHQSTINELTYVTDSLRSYAGDIEYELEVLETRIRNNRNKSNKSRDESNTNFNDSDDAYLKHISRKWSKLGRPANQPRKKAN